MTVQSGKARQIKDALVAMFQAIQYGSEPAFTSVLDNTSTEFDGFPAALVLPDKTVSNTEAFGTMQHVSSYIVAVHIPIGDPSAVEQTQYNTIMDLSDLVIGAVESGYYADFLNQHAPGINGYNMVCKQALIRPVKSKIGPILLCTFNIDVTYSQSVI